MSEIATFSDDDLTAFLDGEADARLHAAISDSLETDAALEERLASLDVPMAAIAEAFEGLLIHAPAMPAMATGMAAPSEGKAARTGWGLRFGLFATGLVAGLSVAMVTGLGTPVPEPRGWVSYVASYQALYSPATLNIPDPSSEQAAEQLATASNAIGFDLSSLPQAQGLTFKRAQILGFNGKPLIQIAFARADGTPVALCIIPAGPDAADLDMGSAEGLDTARWNAAGFGFLLIGGQDQNPLAREAETFRDWSADITT